MAKATKVTTRGAVDLPERIVVTVGWQGRLGEIVSILAKGVNKPGRPRMPARPAGLLIRAALAVDAELSAALGSGDTQAAERLAREITRDVLRPGIRPVNAPSTTKRKGGDKRALRNARGRDAIFKLFRVYVRSFRTGRFRAG